MTVLGRVSMASQREAQRSGAEVGKGGKSGDRVREAGTGPPVGADNMRGSWLYS